jgi:Holliday junction resolvase-like predicted endonuclease
MISNEIQLRNHIVNLLRKDGYETKTEVRLPEGFRVDILAEKNGIIRAIEVKKESRGIADDIVKCQKLLRSPEVAETYVAAPELLISPDHVTFASQIGVGVIIVTGSELKWEVQSRKAREAILSGSWTHPSVVKMGETFQVEVSVRNQGEKIARNLEGHCLPAGPFIFASGSKRRYNLSSLNPKQIWSIEFLIRVKPKIKTGTYPLFTTVTAQNSTPVHNTLDIKVEDD